MSVDSFDKQQEESMWAFKKMTLPLLILSLIQGTLYNYERRDTPEHAYQDYIGNDYRLVLNGIDLMISHRALRYQRYNTFTIRNQSSQTEWTKLHDAYKRDTLGNSIFVMTYWTGDRFNRLDPVRPVAIFYTPRQALASLVHLYSSNKKISDNPKEPCYHREHGMCGKRFIVVKTEALEAFGAPVTWLVKDGVTVPAMRKLIESLLAENLLSKASG